jgi:hypothetical protein
MEKTAWRSNKSSIGSSPALVASMLMAYGRPSLSSTTNEWTSRSRPRGLAKSKWHDWWFMVYRLKTQALTGIMMQGEPKYCGPHDQNP